MLATDRLLMIEQSNTDIVQSIVPLDLDGETIRLILFLIDGSNLRVTEQWQGRILLRYSYYWLTSQNQLLIGWDNSPHHHQVSSHPHHMHVGQQTIIQASTEANLDDVVAYIRKQIA